MAKIIAICGKICCGKTYYANQIKEKRKRLFYHVMNCQKICLIMIEL